MNARRPLEHLLGAKTSIAPRFASLDVFPAIRHADCCAPLHVREAEL